MNDHGRPVVLDTHYWIWQQAGQQDLIPCAIQEQIETAAFRGQLLISAISVWELAMLEAKGRVRLHSPCAQWVNEALDTSGVTIAPLTPEIAIQSTRLPGSIHGDPSDRIIVATARVMGARLATADQKLLDYAKQGHVLLC